MSQGALPPGAPRKQQQQQQHAALGIDARRGRAGGSGSSSDRARATSAQMRSVRARADAVRQAGPSTSLAAGAMGHDADPLGGNRTASTSSHPSSSHDTDFSDAAAQALFGDVALGASGGSGGGVSGSGDGGGGRVGMSSEMRQHLGGQEAARDAGAWLSQRMPSGRGELEQSALAFLDTPTARHAAGGGAMSSMRSNMLAQYTTPSNEARAGEPSLLIQATRRLAASRRPAHELHREPQQPEHSAADDATSAAAAARASLASSGWGSPRGAAMPDEDTLGVLGAAPSAGAGLPMAQHGLYSGYMDGNGVWRSPNKPADAAHAWQIRAPPPFPRLGGAPPTIVAPTNQDGSHSVVRDEEDANNSGLLALSPAVRRLNGLGMTSIRPRESKSSSDASFAPANGSKVSRSSVPSDRSMGTQPSVIEYDMNGIDLVAADEIEARRAQLLQARHQQQPPTEERAALLEAMRSWREDAMKHHLYDTAIFWGNKILSMEVEQIAWNDAYNLATAYFLTHRYAQAEHLLCSPLQLAGHLGERGGSHEDAKMIPSARNDDMGKALAATHRSSKLPASLLAKAHLLDRENGLDEDSELEDNVLTDGHMGTDRKRKRRSFTISGTGTASEAGSVGINGDAKYKEKKGNHGTRESSNKLRDALSEVPDVAGAWRREQCAAIEEVRSIARPPPDGISLVSVSVPCKYLAAQCMVRQGKYQEALDELDSWGVGRNDDELRKAYHLPSKDGLIKLSSSIWHLKGLIHLHLRHVDAARDDFIKSLSLDVKNFESFDQLVRGNLLSAHEQWEFVENLEYVAQAGNDQTQVEALHLVRLMYTALLDKTGKMYAQKTAAARRQLISEYGLGHNPDILLGLAEEMYARMQYEDAYAVTQRIMELSKDHEAALPIHVSSMYMIERLRPSLYLLAHHLTEADPDLPAAWYAVGCWYFGTQRWLEARKHFSKSVQIDPRFAPGWIAFAHTFAHEGESDQAIVSYSTAERNFSSHFLIKLFLGMEHLHQGNLTLAELYLRGSAEVCEEDPLSRNERGVIAYYSGKLDEAITLFRSALQAAHDVQQPPSAWSSTHLNLAYAYRRSGLIELARQSFLRAAELDPDSAAAFVGVGLCFHDKGAVDNALSWYHRAMVVDPGDKHARELANFALRECAHAPPPELFSTNDAAHDGFFWNADGGRDVPEGGTIDETSHASQRSTTGREQGPALNKASSKHGKGHDEQSTSYNMSLAEGSVSIDMDESDL